MKQGNNFADVIKVPNQLTCGQLLTWVNVAHRKGWNKGLTFSLGREAAVDIFFFSLKEGNCFVMEGTSSRT